VEPGELARELVAAVSFLPRLDPVRVGILDCVLVELPDPLSAKSELLECSFCGGGGVAARGIADSVLLPVAVAGRLTPSAPLRSSPVGIILGIRDPASPEDGTGGVAGTLKMPRLAGVVEPPPSANDGPASGLLSGCGLVRQPGADDEGGSLATVLGDFGWYWTRRSAVDGLSTGLRCKMSSAARRLCC